MTEITTSKWRFFQKFGFLYLFVYTILYFFPFPFSAFSFLSKAVVLFNEYTWNKMVPWFGKTILGITKQIPMGPNGSGDTTGDYVKVLLFIIISLIVALLWTFLDRKRKNYKKLLVWGSLYMRYALIYFMIIYGMAKVIKLQFRSPNLLRLIEPLGDFSPMGLAWTYMGFSDTYTFFAGACEVLAALLLLFKRTRTLGALFCAGVMLNIFMMNFS